MSGTDSKPIEWRLRELLDCDWARNFEHAGGTAPRRRFRDNFNPRFIHVYILRLAQRSYEKGWGRTARFFSMVNILIFGLEVSARLPIGPGLVLPHPNGTIIGAGEVGRNVTIFQQVTLGAKFVDHGYNFANRPKVEDDVTITAGAKIIGAIRIGRGSVIGANAVVLTDVPPASLAIGVPATIRPLPPGSASHV